MTEPLNYEDLYSNRTKKVRTTAFRGSPAGIVPFAYGLPDEDSFPIEGLITATSNVLREHGKEALQYGSGRGCEGLVVAIKDRLARAEGIKADCEQVMITNGSTMAIEMVAKMFLDAGDTVLLESPSFLGAIRVFSHCDLNTACVPLDDYGVRPDLLDAKLSELESNGVKPKFFYTMPTFHNPAGVTMPLERRRDVLRVAAKHGIMLLEDDAYGDLRYSGELIPSLFQLDEDGRVIRIGTLSKVLAAGLRLGWILGPREVIAKMALTKIDTGTNPFSSYVAAEYYNGGLIDSHIESLKGLYRARRDAMLAALDKYAPAGCQWTKPDGGFFVWLRLPDGLDANKLLPEAVEEGVNYIAGTACQADGGGGSHLRLSFSYANPEEVTKGIRRLCAVIERAIKRT
jgi:2-aminoadipate transaminase